MRMRKEKLRLTEPFNYKEDPCYKCLKVRQLFMLIYYN